MIANAGLCEKIRELYPDIGECGIDVSVNYDGEKKAWAVNLKKDHQALTTYLEADDADACMIGKKCIGLGLQIAQLRVNIDRMHQEA